MKEQDLLWIEKTNGLMGAGLLLVSLYWMSWRLSLSILIGFLIAAANFWVLKKVILKAFQKQSSGQVGKLKLGMALVFKYLLLFVSVGLSIIYFNLHMGGLLIGMSTLVISMMMLGLKHIFLS